MSFIDCLIAFSRGTINFVNRINRSIARISYAFERHLTLCYRCLMCLVQTQYKNGEYMTYIYWYMKYKYISSMAFCLLHWKHCWPIILVSLSGRTSSKCFANACLSLLFISCLYSNRREATFSANEPFSPRQIYSDDILFKLIEAAEAILSEFVGELFHI